VRWICWKTIIIIIIICEFIRHTMSTRRLNLRRQWKRLLFWLINNFLMVFCLVVITLHTWTKLLYFELRQFCIFVPYILYVWGKICKFYNGYEHIIHIILQYVWYIWGKFTNFIMDMNVQNNYSPEMGDCGEYTVLVPNQPPRSTQPLSLAISVWVGIMSTDDGHSHIGEFCTTIGWVIPGC